MPRRRLSLETAAATPEGRSGRSLQGARAGPWVHDRILATIRTPTSPTTVRASAESSDVG